MWDPSWHARQGQRRLGQRRDPRPSRHAATSSRLHNTTLPAEELLQRRLHILLCKQRQGSGVAGPVRAHPAPTGSDRAGPGRHSPETNAFQYQYNKPGVRGVRRAARRGEATLAAHTAHPGAKGHRGPEQQHPTYIEPAKKGVSTVLKDRRCVLVGGPNVRARLLQAIASVQGLLRAKSQPYPAHCSAGCTASPASRVSLAFLLAAHFSLNPSTPT